jgi:outer membrane protein assembly factor BamB
MLLFTTKFTTKAGPLRRGGALMLTLFVLSGSGGMAVSAAQAQRGTQSPALSAAHGSYRAAGIHPETIYIGCADHNLYAVDAHTGQRIWSFQTGGEVSSSAAVVGGVVYVGSRDGSLYALAGQTGRQIWRFQAGGSVDSSPAVVGDAVYVGSGDHNVYALDARTGDQLWRFATGDQISYSSPAVVGDVVYIGSEDHDVYALDAHTGDQLWRFQTGDKVWASPAVSGGLVYIGSFDHNVYALDAQTGQQLWRFTTGDLVWSSPAVAGGVVYAGSNDDYFYALDAHTGQQLWRFQTGAHVLYGPRVAGGVVYVGSEDHNVYALDVRTGQQLWRFSAGDQIDSAPAVAGGVVYIGANDDDLYALDARTGQKLWAFQAGGHVNSTPAVAGAGTLTDAVRPACCGAHFFPETGHNLAGSFLAFFKTYGGVDVFGYPRTEPFAQNDHLVQYTDHFLLELVGDRVVTAPLGRLLTMKRRFPAVAPFSSTPTHVYVSSTGHSLSGVFLTYWRSHHGAVLLGDPISEVTVEDNGDGSGRLYRVQWFERGRLEYHPELGHTHQVEIGSLGVEDLKQRGWLPNGGFTI